MNKRIAFSTLALLMALPTASYARDHRGDHDGRDDYRRDYRNDRGHYDHYERYDRRDHYDHLRVNVAAPVRFVGQVIALPFQVGAAVIGAVVDVATTPLYSRPRYEPRYEQQEQASYGPPPGYYDDGPRYDAPVGRVYAAPPEYYPPQPEYRGY
jgi:hypothetical protein